MSKQDLHFALIKADRVHNIIVADEEFIAELQTRQPSLWDSIEPVAGDCAIGSVRTGTGWQISTEDQAPAPINTPIAEPDELAAGRVSAVNATEVQG